MKGRSAVGLTTLSVYDADLLACRLKPDRAGFEVEAVGAVYAPDVQMPVAQAVGL